MTKRKLETYGQNGEQAFLSDVREDGWKGFHNKTTNPYNPSEFGFATWNAGYLQAEEEVS